jgi:hypothetical protein
MSLNTYVTPVTFRVYRKGNSTIMALAAVFSPVKGCHGKILFFFNLTGFLRKKLGVAALAIELLPEMKFMFKDHCPDRLNKNNRTATVFLRFGGSFITWEKQLKKKKNKENTA